MVVIYCGDALFQECFERRLETKCLRLLKDGPRLLIDRPAGWALLEHPGLEFARCVILSDNPCPSYRLDLLDRQPAALINLTDEAALLNILEAVCAGSVPYPKVVSPLTPVERKTLRLVALGYTNLEIAKARGVSERTVKNSLVEIYRKLNLRSRVEASHYYFGNWHLLRRCQKPPLVE